MSDLAFNMNGEPFDLLPTMAAWRVRKLKPKGAPEVVYGRDCLPLFLPLDADIGDLRREGCGDGRYRLDQVDEQNRPLPSAQSAYVYLHPVERAPEPPPPAPPAQIDITASLVAALLESQKQHTELARMYVSQFPVVANAMAGVVRSASDAGLTARVPLVLPAAPAPQLDEAAHGNDADDEEPSDESDDDEISDEIEGEQLAVEVAAQPEYSWARVAQTLADHVTPHVGPLLAGLPGLAATLGATRAQAAIDARGPDPKGPAPAEAEADASSGPMAGLTAGMVVRLNTIMAQLNAVEQQFARVLLEEIPAEELPIWFARLGAMSVDEAVAYVRARFREGQAAAGRVRPAEPRAPRSAPPPASPTVASASRREGRRSTPAATTTAQRAIRRSTPSNGLALLDEGTQAHLAAIDAALTQDEATALRKQFAALAPRERASWVATLVVLPVVDAVAAIRAQLAITDNSTTAQAAESSSTSRMLQDPPTAATSAPSNAAAPTQRAGASSAGAIALTPDDAPAALTHATDPSASQLATGSAVDTTAALTAVTVARDADGHLAEVEHALTAEERVRMNAMFSRLSPEAREEWLDKLLSSPPAQGTAMIRAALRTEATQPRIVPAQITHAPITTAAPTDGQVAAIQTSDSAAERYEPVVDDIELDDAAALNDAELDIDQPDGTAERETVDQPHTSPAVEGATTPQDSTHARATGDARHGMTTDSPPSALATALSTPNTDAPAHFRAIEAALTLAERMRAHELAAQRPAAELRSWYADLLRLSVPDAIAKIRAELTHSNDAHPTTRKGDVP